MKSTPALHVPNHNRIRVGIYRDVTSSPIDVGPAVDAVDALRRKFGRRIVLAEADKYVQLTDYSDVTADSINWLEAPNHMNFVLTNKTIADTDSDATTIGITVHRPVRRPFVVIDAYMSRYSMRKVLPHEAAHLVRVKDSGEYYDKESHCNHPACYMQPIIDESSNDFCNECSQQLDERLYKLSQANPRNAGLFRRALQLLSGHVVQTVHPFEIPEQPYYYHDIA